MSSRSPQSLGVLHVDRPRVVEAAAPDKGVARERRHVTLCLADEGHGRRTIADTMEAGWRLLDRLPADDPLRKRRGWSTRWSNWWR